MKSKRSFVLRARIRSSFVVLLAGRGRPGSIDEAGDGLPSGRLLLLRENLKLSFEQRAEKHLRALQMVEELRRVGKKLAEHRLKACAPSRHVVCSTLGAE